MKKKLSWRDKYATAKNKTIKIRMFDGEIAEIELKRLTGADELAKAGAEMQELISLLKQLETDKGQETDMGLAMDTMPKAEQKLAKLAAMVVVLDESDAKQMADEDWLQFVRNTGGVAGKLVGGITASIGLSAGVKGVDDLRF